MENLNPYIAVIETSDYLHRLEANQFNLFTQKLHNSLTKTINHFDGSIIEHNDNKYVISFIQVTDVVMFALKVQSKFKYITPSFDNSIRKLSIGICHPLETQDQTVEMATDICEFVKYELVLTSEVKAAYMQQQKNTFIDRNSVRVLKDSEFQFIADLIAFLKLRWNDYELTVEDLAEPLGYSSSQIYRKTLALSGKPPSLFIRDFRLNRALDLIHKRKDTIGRIAKRSGFRSPTYFSKCFKERFGLLASKYVKQHAVQ